MDRPCVEQLTASLAVVLLFVLTIGGIVMGANGMFEWDLLPQGWEKYVYFVAFCFGVVILASVFVNVMLNFSIIARNTSHLVKILG
ncbi:hypothetical protein HY310_02690, partial [Candidatus Microgenomates bacterium]|nr:hypothetical protein [Candidatus Microgenomates bacterium]